MLIRETNEKLSLTERVFIHYRSEHELNAQFFAAPQCIYFKANKQRRSFEFKLFAVK